MKELLEIVKSIKAQSTVIIIILLIYSFYSLKSGNNISSPITISGFVSFIVSILLALGNFFIFMTSESYKNIIEELKGVINTLRSQQKFSDKRIRDYLTDNAGTQKKEITSGYTSIEEGETQSS